MKNFFTAVCILLCSSSFAQSDSSFLEKMEGLTDSFQLAYQELSDIISLDSSDVKALLERADLVSGLNDKTYFATVFGDLEIYNFALGDYDKAVELEPYDFLTYYKRAVLKDRFLFYEKALEDYDEALNYAWIKTDKMRVRVNRARLKAKVGEEGIAIRDLEKALLEDRDNLALLNTIALIHTDLEEYTEALKYLNRSLQFYPDDVVTFSNIGFVALNAGKFQKSINIYNDQIKKNPERSYMFCNRGFAHFKMGNTKAALKDISKSIALDPLNSFAFKNRAIIYMSMGKEEKACADLKRAKALGYTTEYDDKVIVLLFEKCLEVNVKRGER